MKNVLDLQTLVNYAFINSIDIKFGYKNLYILFNELIILIIVNSLIKYV